MHEHGLLTRFIYFLYAMHNLWARPYSRVALSASPDSASDSGYAWELESGLCDETRYEARTGSCALQSPRACAVNINFIPHYSSLHLPIVCSYPSQQLASDGRSRLQPAPVLVPLGPGRYCVTVHAFFDSPVAVWNPDRPPRSGFLHFSRRSVLDSPDNLSLSRFMVYCVSIEPSVPYRSRAL